MSVVLDELASMHAHWIEGSWHHTTSDTMFTVRDPATELVVGTVPGASAADVDAAVRSAAGALPAWRSRSLEDRLEMLGRFCDEMEADAEALAEIVVREVGAPVSIAGPAHVGIAIEIARSFVDVARAYPTTKGVGRSILLREPVGVVGCITPWNLPLILVMQKLPAALAAGCTVVLKPSELTPFGALRLAQLTESAGLPPGVVNVVTGDGPTSGEALVSHPLVDKVSFTGSTRAGRRVAALATQGVKRIGLELGGKSANVVLPDGDLERAIATGVGQATFNAGQSCIAWSRILVHERVLDEASERVVAAMSRLRVGDPWSTETDVGPLVSATARERVQAYIRSGMEQGARLASGGPSRPEGLERGYYVRPTVLSGVTREMTVAREEIFGPVVCVMAYRDEDDAAVLANSTDYGLHGAVWSADEEHAVAFAGRIRTGMVCVNGYDFDPVAPFGGMKHSGVGRELGAEGLAGFYETKVVQRCRVE